MCHLCVHRDMKHLGSLESTLELLSVTSQATLTHLFCSPNFPRVSYLDERTLTHEPIVKFTSITLIVMVTEKPYLKND